MSSNAGLRFLGFRCRLHISPKCSILLHDECTKQASPHNHYYTYIFMRAHFAQQDPLCVLLHTPCACDRRSRFIMSVQCCEYVRHVGQGQVISILALYCLAPPESGSRILYAIHGRCIFLCGCGGYHLSFTRSSTRLPS